jgi:hypothetical protein
MAIDQAALAQLFRDTFLTYVPTIGGFVIALLMVVFLYLLVRDRLFK